MFRLPPEGHKAREFFDLGTLAEILNPKNAGKLFPVWEACRKARAMFAGEGLKPSRVYFVIVRLDTAERWLISVGPKGGWRKEWNFGTGVRPYKAETEAFLATQRIAA